jgi:hypothetical protein
VTRRQHKPSGIAASAAATGEFWRAALRKRQQTLHRIRQ